MAEHYGLIDSSNRLRQCGFIGPHEQEAGRHGYFCIGAAISADETNPAPPLATVKMTGSPFHVLKAL
jgi:hypothetical protein